MAMAKTHRTLCPRAPTISSTTIAMCGHGGPPAAPFSRHQATAKAAWLLGQAKE